MRIPFWGEEDPSWTQERLQRMDWLAFEALINDLWEDRGYRTERTQPSKDGGVDVRAEYVDIKRALWDSRSFIPDVDLLIIDAKRHRDDVRRKHVEKMVNTLDKEEAQHALIVTSSSLAGSAERAAEENGLDWVDGEDLVKLLKKSNLNTGSWQPPDDVKRRIRDRILQDHKPDIDISEPIWAHPDKWRDALSEG
jgi:restriction endonuclease Mrr